MAKMTVECEAWRPLRKNTLLGFATIRIVELDPAIIDVPVNTSHGKIWASPPSKPGIKDGTVILGDNGRPQYFPIIEFGRKETRDAFSRAVVEAVTRFDPNALQCGEGAA
jgi:hypothetical protein